MLNPIQILLYVGLFLFFIFVVCRLYRALYIESFTIPDVEASALLELAKEQNDLLEENSEGELMDSSGEIQKLLLDGSNVIDKMNNDIEDEETTDDEETTEYEETTDDEETTEYEE